MAGDKFKQNNENILKNFFRDYQDDQDNRDVNHSGNFLIDFFHWTEKKTNRSREICFFQFFFELVLIGIMGLLASGQINVILTGALAISSSLIAGGVARRNLANIYNLENNIANKIKASTTKMIEEASQDPFPIKEEHKLQLIKLSKKYDYKMIDNIANNFSNYLGILGIIAFCIGLKFIDTTNPTDMLRLFSFMTIFPLSMPIFMTLSKTIRSSSNKKKLNYFNKTISIIHSKSSYNIDANLNSSEQRQFLEKISRLNDNFKTHIETSDCNGKIIGESGFKKDETSDNYLNPAKLTSFPTWLSAKTHRVINDNLTRFKNRDLADYRNRDQEIIDVPLVSPAITVSSLESTSQPRTVISLGLPSSQSNQSYPRGVLLESPRQNNIGIIT